jgi:hypothetical protein
MRSKPGLTTIAILILVSCVIDPRNTYLQGRWAAVNPAESRSENYIWEFNNGTFYRKQEIDRGDPLITHGYYQIKSLENDIVTLLLFNITGDRISYENNDFELRLQLLQETEQLKITGTLFDRDLSKFP